MKFTSKILFTTLALSVFYSVTVLMAPTWWQASQHQWQDNTVAAQEFIYKKDHAYTNVIVGSSLSTRLVRDSLIDTYILAFSGLSTFDGLKILTKGALLPKNVFIEMNFIFRPENADFINSLFSPVMFYPRKYIYALREKNQPLAIIGREGPGIVKEMVMKKTKVPNETNKLESIPETKMSILNFSKLLKFQMEEYTKPPEQVILDKSFAQLKDYVEILKKRGVNIVFFEMPVNKKLENLPRAKEIRNAFYNYFPENKYNYTYLPKELVFQTTDGIHLGKVEALIYTNYFKSKKLECFQ